MVNVRPNSITIRSASVIPSFSRPEITGSTPIAGTGNFPSRFRHHPDPYFPRATFTLLLLSLRLLDLGPGIAQRHGPVEDQLARRRIGIDAEIALPLELIPAAFRRAGQAR